MVPRSFPNYQNSSTATCKPCYIFLEDNYDDVDHANEFKNEIIALANNHGNAIDVNFHIDANDNNKDCIIAYDGCNNKQTERQPSLDSWLNTMLSKHPIQASLVTADSISTNNELMTITQ